MMNEPPPPESAALGQADHQDPECALASHKRLRHLFRHSLRQGVINPLMHILLHYRQDRPEPEHGSDR